VLSREESAFLLKARLVELIDIPLPHEFANDC